MEDVKLPDISGMNVRGNSQRANSRGAMNRQNSMGSQNIGGKSAFVAQKERKDIERDAQLLANRIALLKQEEMKTWKKIEETKKRAGDVVRLKQKNNEKVQEKMQKQQINQMRDMEARNRIARMRDERENEKKKIKDAIMLHKKEEAKQTKFIG